MDGNLIAELKCENHCQDLMELKVIKWRTLELLKTLIWFGIWNIPKLENRRRQRKNHPKPKLTREQRGTNSKVRIITGF